MKKTLLACLVLVAAFFFIACSSHDSATEESFTPPTGSLPEQEAQESEQHNNPAGPEFNPPTDPLQKLPETDSNAQTGDTQTAEQRLIDPSPFVLDKTYSSENLILTYPSEKNWGWLKVTGVDAQKLYQTLRIRAEIVKENETWTATYIRRGQSITCYREAKRAEPLNVQYTCSIYMDYATGGVIPQKEKPIIDITIPSLEETYSGESMMLVSPHSAALGSIIIKGMDAKALFFAMKEETTGSHIRCHQQTAKATPDNFEYTCRISFNYYNGSIYEPHD